MQDILDKIGVNINLTFSLIFFSLIWVRTLAMSSIIPFLFGKPVPRQIIVGVALAIAIFTYPLVAPKTPVIIEDHFLLMILYLKEVFYGVTIGMSVAVIFYAFSAVGQMVDNQRGSSIARLLIPQLNEQSSISGIFFFQFGIVLYFAFGGHLVFFDSFISSFKLLPILEFPATGQGLFPLMDLFMRITGEVILISVQMCAPVIIAIFMADIILGIANRVAPQINVWELGFHVKGYLGILMLLVALTVIGEQIHRYCDQANSYTRQTIEFLQGKVPVAPPEEPPPSEGQFNKDLGPPQVK